MAALQNSTAGLIMATLTGDIKGLRIGLAKEYMIGGLDPEVRAAVGKAVDALAAAGASVLSSCDALSRTDWFPKVLGSGEKLTELAQHVIAPRRAMARQTTSSGVWRVPASSGKGKARITSVRWKPHFSPRIRYR